MDEVRINFDDFEKYSGAKLNGTKCEFFPIGSWMDKPIITTYKTVSENIKITGVNFGQDEKNWSELIFKMNSKLNVFKIKYRGCCILLKAQILNTFILPVAYYKLKVLNPPENFFTEVHKMVIEYLWESGRHWLKALFIYLPSANGGLGVKNIFVQYLIFRCRAIIKGSNPDVSSYFLRNLKSVANDILFNNSTSDSSFIETLQAIHEIDFKFSHLSNEDVQKISLINKMYFPLTSFPFLLKNNFKTVRDALHFRADAENSLRSNQKRQIDRVKRIRLCLERHKGNA
jgi:hypothetical protein